MRFFNSNPNTDSEFNSFVNCHELKWIEAYLSWPPSSWDCLFIEGFDELFSEIPEIERDSILFHLEQVISACISDGKPYFIDFRPGYFDINWVEQYPFLTYAIHKQYEKEPCFNDFKEIAIDNFFDECQELGLKTILLGGNFGDACVWSRACRISESIYAQSMPRYAHPNIRFDGPHKIFQNAIIEPMITQGHHVDSDVDSNKLYALLCFPQNLVVPKSNNKVLEEALCTYFEDDILSPIQYTDTVNQRIEQIVNTDNNRVLFPMLSNPQELLPEECRANLLF